MLPYSALDKVHTMSELNHEVESNEEAFVMPTIAHKIVLHFKNLVVGRDDDKIADLKHVADSVEHVKYSETVNKSVKDGTDQNCVKRDSEEYTVMIPNFESLLSDMVEGIEGLTLIEVKRVQELVAKHADDYARKLVDGAVVRDEDGNITGIEGFALVTDEVASFALAAAESFGRKAGGSKQTVPVAVRDAGIEAFRNFLAENEVPEKGIQLMVAAAKSYFSPTTIAQLPPEALEKIKGRIEAWYADAEEEQQLEFGLLYNRWVDKLAKALKPEELDIDIF